MVPFDIYRCPTLQYSMITAENVGTTPIVKYQPVLINRFRQDLPTNNYGHDGFQYWIEVEALPTVGVSYPPEKIAIATSMFGTGSTDKYGTCNIGSPLIAKCDYECVAGDIIGGHAQYSPPYQTYLSKRGYGFLYHGPAQSGYDSHGRIGFLTRAYDSNACVAQYIEGVADTALPGSSSAKRSPVYCSDGNILIRMAGYYLFGFSVSVYSGSNVGSDIVYGLYETTLTYKGIYCRAENTGNPLCLSMTGTIYATAGQTYSINSGAGIGSLTEDEKFFWMAYLGQ